MIISASRRTDIPAFYSDWFINRVRDGYFYRVNPFNNKQVSGFSLKPEHVDAICFWTKNPAPLLKHLPELDDRGLNYYFQFTLNPYGKEFEPNVPPLAERVATFHELARCIGQDRVIWRYDPIILTSATPLTWHLEQAELIASMLKGATHRLVFSYYDFYGKGQGRLHAALNGTGIVLEDITAHEHENELMQLARGFKTIATRYALRVLTCSEEIDLSALDIDHGACIDGTLIRELFGSNPSEMKDRNQRKDCGCVESVDMGIYNTCYFGCSYCYANFSDTMIENSRHKHYDDSASLLERYDGAIQIQTLINKKKSCAACQQMLDL